MAKKRAKKPARRARVPAADLNREVWPQERQVLMRPDRLAYVRKLIRPKTCVFCDAAKSPKAAFERLLLWKSNQTMVVMNKFPYNTGHLLILPTEHIGDLRELSVDVYNELSTVLREASTILLKAYSCSGLNIGMNHGAVAGAGIPEHLHWHIVPRWQGDTNFFPLIAETKVLPETLEQSYCKLKPLFDTLDL